MSSKIRNAAPQRSRPTHSRLVSMPSEIPNRSLISTHAEKSIKKRPESGKSQKRHAPNANTIITSDHNEGRQSKAYRSVLKERIGKPADLSRTHQDLSSNHFGGLETSQLKKEVKKLQKTVKKQNETLLKLCDSTAKEDHELTSLMKTFNEPKTIESLIGELQEKLHGMQENEAKLVNELKEQKEATDNVVEKLHMLQGETAREIEYFKHYYKENYSNNLAEELNHCKRKVHEFDDHKEYLVRTLKELESVQAVDEEYEKAIHKKIRILKEESEHKRKENEFVKEELRNLERYIKEKEIARDHENELLKEDLDELKQENEILIEKDKQRKKQSSHENELIKNKIKILEDEIARKEKKIVQNEVSYQNHLEKMESEVNNLRNENRRLEEYERKYQGLRREEVTRDEKRKAKEREYNDRITLTKRVQDKRKKEWSTIYNELLKEVWDLKSGIGVLENGNQRSLSSLESKSFDHYV